MTEPTHLLGRRQILAISALAGGVSAVAPLQAAFKVGKLLDAGQDLAKAESLSDADLKGYFDQMAVDSDRQNPLASPRDAYGKRIAALSKGLQTHDGLNLDVKAYLVRDVNAFAMANGTIRIFAGLMDRFTDDEIRYVIGHEIGHVKHGHTKKRMQTALRTSALQKGVSGAGGTVGRIAAGELGELFVKVISAQHSQANEKEADDYAMAFLKGKSFPGMAAVTALDKLAAMEGPASPGGPPKWLSTHPSPAARSKRMRALV